LLSHVEQSVVLSRTTALECDNFAFRLIRLKKLYLSGSTGYNRYDNLIACPETVGAGNGLILCLPRMIENLDKLDLNIPERKAQGFFVA
jgi:hypothetical protein